MKRISLSSGCQTSSPFVYVCLEIWRRLESLISQYTPSLNHSSGTTWIDDSYTLLAQLCPYRLIAAGSDQHHFMCFFTTSTKKFMEFYKAQINIDNKVYVNLLPAKSSRLYAGTRASSAAEPLHLMLDGTCHLHNHEGEAPAFIWWTGALGCCLVLLLLPQMMVWWYVNQQRKNYSWH